MNKTSGSVIVSWDFSKEDTGVLIVGKQKNGDVTIINAFQGKEAMDIRDRLTKVRFDSSASSALLKHMSQTTRKDDKNV